MYFIFDICDETGLSLDDVRLILSDFRADWADTEQVSATEAEIIRRSVRAALPDGNAQITPVDNMNIDQQERLISNASQVLGLPLVLAVTQEIKAIDTLHQIKNAIALNVIDVRQAELDAAIQHRSESRQQAYVTAITDLANQMQKPVSVVEEMKADIDKTNAKLEALLAQVKAGK